MNLTHLGLMVGGLVMAAPQGRIFLNGVPIDGVRGQQFSNATVRIDDQGRVHIDAPDYEVAPAAETVRLKPARLAPGPPRAGRSPPRGMPGLPGTGFCRVSRLRTSCRDETGGPRPQV